MPTYAKLTFAVFKGKLKAGEYDGATGARRAIGKSSWEESEKDSARKLVAKQFGEGAPKASKKVAKKEKAPKVKKVVAKGKTAKSAKAAKTPKAPKVVKAKKAAAAEKTVDTTTSPVAVPKRRGRPPKSASVAAVPAVDTPKALRAPRAKKEKPAEKMKESHQMPFSFDAVPKAFEARLAFTSEYFKGLEKGLELIKDIGVQSKGEINVLDGLRSTLGLITQAIADLGRSAQTNLTAELPDPVPPPSFTPPEALNGSGPILTSQDLEEAQEQLHN